MRGEAKRVKNWEYAQLNNITLLNTASKSNLSQFGPPAFLARISDVQILLKTQGLLSLRNWYAKPTEFSYTSLTASPQRSRANSTVTRAISRPLHPRWANWRRKQMSTSASGTDHPNSQLTLISLVLESLEEALGDDPHRKCFRLIGGVLVERTVKDVVPAVKIIRDGVSPFTLLY
jgi:hypothetical protein